ncbi:redox-responsive ATPase YchF [Candidatus Xenohaliotis californiensis]|uniref:Ribosome-binding ATPase YchF n=1 Tax=Candidatus Xenohaliotis californiensis TaxID=84677 RepID=A0ABM9N907_9RICK|nr:redox-responsive ATPase YchF [Candidatus Xenohaliotis californiensis]
MSFKCGVVGLPNVGKSTLFNALTASNAAEIANYPFCTIEPNSGTIVVPDYRIEQLAKIAGSAIKKPTKIEIFDIAGLVAGAHKGEGLGNLFLGYIREVDAIIHVVRCFDDSNITHVANKVDPLFDIGVVNLELIMADLASLEKRLPVLEKKVKRDPGMIKMLEAAKGALNVLHQEKMACEALVPYDDLQLLQLITTKPVLYVCNVDEQSIVNGNSYSDIVCKQSPNAVLVSAAMEAALSEMSAEEQSEFFFSEGLGGSSLSGLIRAAYDLLGLITFFTVGPKEARAWTLKKGSFAPQAAGIIHTDMEKGFIKAETISYNDYIKHAGELACKEAGKSRQEGKDYIVADGDIFNFKFNI